MGLEKELDADPQLKGRLTDGSQILFGDGPPRF